MCLYFGSFAQGWIPGHATNEVTGFALYNVTRDTWAGNTGYNMTLSMWRCLELAGTSDTANTQNGDKFRIYFGGIGLRSPPSEVDVTYKVPETWSWNSNKLTRVLSFDYVAGDW